LKFIGPDPPAIPAAVAPAEGQENPADMSVISDEALKSEEKLIFDFAEELRSLVELTGKDL
jgi:hypothetical protein